MRLFLVWFDKKNCLWLVIKLLLVIVKNCYHSSNKQGLLLILSVIHMSIKRRRKLYGVGNILWCGWLNCLFYHCLPQYWSHLANQVREVKPDVLLGLSAVGGLFSKEVSGRIHITLMKFVVLLKLTLGLMTETPWGGGGNVPFLYHASEIIMHFGAFHIIILPWLYMAPL